MKFKLTFVRHFDFFSFGDDYVEGFLAVGTLVLSFCPLLNAFFAELVTTTLNLCKMIIFHFFDTDCANIFRKALI